MKRNQDVRGHYTNAKLKKEDRSTPKKRKIHPTTASDQALMTWVVLFGTEEIEDDVVRDWWWQVPIGSDERNSRLKLAQLLYNMRWVSYRMEVTEKEGLPNTYYKTTYYRFLTKEGEKRLRFLVQKEEQEAKNKLRFTNLNKLMRHTNKEQ